MANSIARSIQEFQCYMDALTRRNITKMKELYDRADNEMKMLTLGIAVYYGEMIIVQFFLNSGFDINTRDKRMGTPLHWACDRLDSKIARLLINRGANLNATNREGLTPMDVLFMNYSTYVTGCSNPPLVRDKYVGDRTYCETYHSPHNEVYRILEFIYGKGFIMIKVINIKYRFLLKALAAHLGLPRIYFDDSSNKI